ncbi:tail fiber domain-containing protein [Paracoccus onubensis]|nr:tail fiber domain-containing protein [Paracoccus onubensis]
MGENLLSWMQDQAEITNRWAAEDRHRQENVFIPLQNEYIREAYSWDSPERKERAASEAIADVRQQQQIAEGTRLRSAMRMGVNPASGAYNAGAREADLNATLAASGAGNMARRRVESEADSRQANAINLGSGLAVNPATSMGLSNGAIQSGAQGAMQGYGQQGQLLTNDYNARMSSWQADQQANSGFFGALGTVAGMMSGNPLSMFSSKEYKTDKKKLGKDKALGAIREMPVEEWSYKPGIADEGRHIGPYAEDFQQATGVGDGKTIDIPTAIGVTMGAIRDLDAKVSRLEGVKEAA